MAFQVMAKRSIHREVIVAGDQYVCQDCTGSWYAGDLDPPECPAPSSKNYIFATGEREAISLSEQDRRFMVGMEDDWEFRNEAAAYHAKEAENFDDPWEGGPPLGFGEMMSDPVVTFLFGLVIGAALALIMLGGA